MKSKFARIKAKDKCRSTSLNARASRSGRGKEDSFQLKMSSAFKKIEIAAFLR